MSLQAGQDDDGIDDLREDAIARLNAVLPKLRGVQVVALVSIADALQTPLQAAVLPESDFATSEFAELIGDILVVHHVLSSEAFTKDKFEHAMEKVLSVCGHQAALAARGNPGHDLTVDDERWSLKSQADQSIDPDKIHISKFRELGQGRWDSEEDLVGLRKSMFDHMDGYDRIFTIRCLSAHRGRRDQLEKEYELVEIPKALLMESADFPCIMKQDSTQTPKPGVCDVTDPDGSLRFQLYFDGGTERKLQVKKLRKDLCTVHATWRFKLDGSSPTERLPGLEDV